MAEIGTYNFDDGLIDQALSDRMPHMRVYCPDRVYIVLGCGSSENVELNLHLCVEDRMPILRRRGGGCAVVLDPGNVIVSLVLPASGTLKIRELFSIITGWLIDGLEKSGIDGIYRDGISDLVIDDRKIAGACMQRKKDYIYFSMSILFKPDITLIERYLPHPPREPSYRRHRSHREFLTSLCEYSGADDTADFIKTLSGNLDIGLIAVGS